MEKEIKLLIMSMKKSPRLPFLINKLQKLKIKYKIFYGINEKNLQKKYLVYKYYNRKVAEEYTGREMGFNEIGASYTFLKILRYCLKKKLKNSIILNDDFYPSKLFKEWIDKKIYFEGKKIIGFQCVPTGFLKKNCETVLDGKIKIHEAKTHLFNAGCNQVTLEFVKEFLKITKNKIVGNADWPFNFRKHNITLLQTLPFLFHQDNRGFSYLIKERNTLEKISFKNLRKNLYKIFGMKFANKIFNFLRIPYYILFIPFLFRKYKNLDYYIEYYFEKNFYKSINHIFNFYIDVENIFSLKSSYPKDLKKYAHYRVFDI
jgi:GR25 family glycosyltransferase involved in LPS biosynthesis